MLFRKSCFHRVDILIVGIIEDLLKSKINLNKKASKIFFTLNQMRITILFVKCFSKLFGKMASSTDISLHKTRIFILKHCKEDVVCASGAGCGVGFNFIFLNGLLCHFALIVNVLGELSLLSDATITEYNPQTVRQTCAWIVAPVDICIRFSSLLQKKKEAS